MNYSIINLKSTNKWALFLLFTFLSTEILAGGTARVRTSSCKWWRKTHIAKARVSTIIPQCSKSDKSCSGTAVGCIVGCGYQNAWAWSTSNAGTDGETYHWSCTRGEPVPEFIQKVESKESLVLEEAISQRIEKSRSTFDDVIFDNANRTVTIKNINVNIELKNESKYISELKLSLLDEIFNNYQLIGSNTIWNLNIVLSNDGVLVNNEPLNDDRFKYSKNSEYAIFKIENLDLVIDVPEHISMEYLAVELENDARPSVEDYSETAIMETESKLAKLNGTFVIYPNPVKSILNFEFDDNINSDEIKVSIFNKEGNLLQTQKMELPDGNSYNKIDVANLREGLYFLVVEVNGEVYTKSFEKQ